MYDCVLYMYTYLCNHFESKLRNKLKMTMFCPLLRFYHCQRPSHNTTVMTCKLSARTPSPEKLPFKVLVFPSGCGGVLRQPLVIGHSQNFGGVLVGSHDKTNTWDGE